VRIILSRKGLDSGVCDLNNLLLTDANNKQHLIMIPIPSKNGKDSYDNLSLSQDKNVSNVAKSYLSQSKIISRESLCHADPNIINFYNEPVFLGSIGQVDQSQSHLKNKNIKEGDLIIFFGVFNNGSVKKANLEVQKNNPKHIMFGYMQIGEIIETNNLKRNREEIEKQYPWITKQPHWNGYEHRKNNCIYVASENCSFDNTIKGFGVFEFNENLILTRDNDNCLTHWNLPKELSGLEISYHSTKSHKDGYFQSACRGQEFVIEENKKAEEWAINLIKSYKK